MKADSTERSTTKESLRFKLGLGIGTVIRGTSENLFWIVLPYLAFLFVGGFVAKEIVHFIPALHRWFDLLMAVCALGTIYFFFFVDDRFEAWRNRTALERKRAEQYRRRHSRSENKQAN